MPNAIKFLDSYAKEDRGIYFGRDKEIKALYQKVKESKIVILYGLSGTGKTSLIQCGLANEFSPSDWLEITIRRGGFTSIIEAIGDRFKSISPNIDYIGPVLVEPLKQIYLENLKPIYLIFDQFEELFISNNEREIRQTVSFISDIVQDNNMPVTIIFSLREEYFANLDKFEKKIPNIYDSKFRLERMSRTVVEGVIRDIATSSKIEIGPLAIDAIINIIENKKTKTVELPYLQVYLRKIFSGLDETKTVTVEYIQTVGKLDDVLADLLDETVRQIVKDNNISEEDIWKFLINLITNEGTKKSLPLSEIQADEKTDQTELIIKKLTESQIIHVHDQFLELKHDSLASKIQSKRTADEIVIINVCDTLKNVKKEGAFLTEEQVNVIEPYKHQLKEVIRNADELSETLKFLQSNTDRIKSNKRKAGITSMLLKVLGGTLVLALVIILFMVVTGYQKSYNQNLKQAQTAKEAGDFEKAGFYYNTALEHPWFVQKDKDSLLAAIELSQQMANDKNKADTLFQQGMNQLEKGGRLDSAYISFQRALQLKKDPIIEGRLNSVRERIQLHQIELQRAIDIFENAGDPYGKYYSKKYRDTLQGLVNLIGK